MSQHHNIETSEHRNIDGVGGMKVGLTLSKLLQLKETLLQPASSADKMISI